MSLHLPCLQASSLCYVTDIMLATSELPAPMGSAQSVHLQASGFFCYMNDIVLAILELPAPCTF